MAPWLRIHSWFYLPPFSCETWGQFPIFSKSPNSSNCKQGCCDLVHDVMHAVALKQGSPTSRLWTGTSCQISGGVRSEIKCTMNILSLSHPETILCPPVSWENCLPWNQSLVPKMLGIAVLKDPQHLVKSQWWELHQEGKAAGVSGALTRDLPQGMYLSLCPTHHLWSLRSHLPQMLRSLTQLADPETQVEQYWDPQGSPSPRVHIKPKEDGMSMERWGWHETIHNQNVLQSTGPGGERGGPATLQMCWGSHREGLTAGQEGRSQCSHPSPVAQLHGDTVAEMISSGPSQGRPGSQADPRDGYGDPRSPGNVGSLPWKVTCPLPVWV